MIRKSKTLIFFAALVFSLSTLTVGYGFWTDHLDLEGEADIRMSINVIDDIVLEEKTTEEAIQIIPETVPPDSGGSGEVEFIDVPSVVEENPDTTLPEADDPAEPPVEPTIEPPAESTVEPPAESTVEPPAESTVEPPAELTVDAPNVPETDQTGGSGSTTGQDTEMSD
jgi:hypothetical protein